MKRHLLCIVFSILAIHLMAQTADSCLRLTVTDCIDLALQNNLELQNAELEIAKAQATKNEARAMYFPTVSVNALTYNSLNPLLSVGIEDIPNAFVREILYNLYAQYGALMGLKKEYSWAKNGTIINAMAIEPVYVGGRIINGNKLAKLGIEAAEYQAKIKEEEVCMQTECLYWQIVSLQEKVATLDQLDQLLDTLSKDLDGAIQAGLVMPTDKYKVTVKQNESQLNRKKVEDGITLLKMALAQIIGKDWQTLVLTDTITVETDPISHFQNAESAVALRNETHLLDLSIKAEDLKKKMTLGEALPSLMVGGSANYHTILEHTKPNAMVFAMLQIPLSDWHKTSYKLKKHHFDKEMAENSRRDFTEKMTLQTNQAWFNLQQSWLRINMARTAVNDAEANVKITSDYYEAGMVSLTDLLEAETMLKLSRDELTDSRVDYQINLVKYKQLTQF